MDSNDDKNGEEHLNSPNARKRKHDELTNVDQPAEEGQQKADCTEKKNDGENSNIELESLPREELIMQLEAAKSEIEQKTKENDALHNQLNELRHEEQIVLQVNQMKIQLPSENWFDLLAFVPRYQLAKIVPIIGNPHFATIVQTFLHGHSKITLDKMVIMQPYNEHPNDCPRVRVWQKQMHRFLRFKLADAQIPKNIRNFKAIKLSYSYLDPLVINFLRQFQQNSLLENVNLYVHKYPEFLPDILPVIASIDSIVIGMSSLPQFTRFCDNPKKKSNGISQMLKSKLAQARIMQLIGYHNRRFNSLDWCCRWLYNSNTPNENGKPRILIITITNDESARIYRTVFDRIQQDFLTATRPVSFFVSIYVPRTFQWDQDISLENGQTNEKLMVRKAEIGEYYFDKRMLISRCPSGAAKQWIKQNEEEVLDWGVADQNRLIEF